MNGEQRNLVIGFIMGILLVVSVAGLIFLPNITLWDKLANAGRIVFLLLMMIVMALFWVASED